MNQRLVLHPEPRLEAVLETIQKVEAFARASQLSSLNTYALTVAVEELLTNTIMFGFKDMSAPEVVVSLAVRGKRVVCEISDNGTGFDPRSANSDSSHTDARDQAFPSQLIRETAPHLDWRSEGGRNLVRLEYDVGDQDMEETGG